MTAESLSTRQRLLMSQLYLCWQRSDTEGHRGLATAFSHLGLSANGPVSLPLDPPQNPLVWHDIPPSTQLSMLERTVSRSKVEEWK